MDVAAINSYRKVVQGDQGERLILEHLGYVRHILGRLVVDLPNGVDVENLEAAGVLGLVEAAGQFDPARGIAFTTYSFPRIRGAIIDELRRNSPLSHRMHQRWRIIREAYPLIEPPVSPEELASRTGLDVDEVIECLEAIRLSNPDSWHDELGSQSLSEPEPPISEVEQEEEQHLLTEAILQLPLQQRRVVTLYYLEDLRLKEIGEVLGLSESRISRILTAAEFQLKESVQRRINRRGIPFTHATGASL